MNLYQKALRTVRGAVGGSPIRFTYSADGFGVRKKYIPFLHDDKFKQAWDETVQLNAGLWAGDMPDIRWRCHTCAWVASNCMRLNGDFAEFGVNTGILSSMILKTVDFDSNKKFYLYDTFAGIPEDLADSAEIEHTRKMNESIYSHDGLAVAKKVFAPFEKNVEFVVGRLPETIKPSGIEKIAYASIDLNSVVAEMGVANEIWDKLTPGGFIVLDDYGFGGHEKQNAAWNTFAKQKERMIFALPTGQGLLQK